MPSPGDSPPRAATPDAGSEGDGKATAAPDEAKPSRLPGGPIQRGATLRRALLAQLTPLVVTADSAGAMKVDPSAVDLDADAFIGPLHAIVSEGQR